MSLENKNASACENISNNVDELKRARCLQFLKLPFAMLFDMYLISILDNESLVRIISIYLNATGSFIGPVRCSEGRILFGWIPLTL